jgi:hypothetical protein
MADEESKYFSLTEAERLRAQLEPVLIEAMESRRKLGEALGWPFDFLRENRAHAIGSQSLGGSCALCARADSSHRLRGEGSGRRPIGLSRAH